MFFHFALNLHGRPITPPLWVAHLRRHLYGHADDAGRANVHECVLESYVRASVNDLQWARVRYAGERDGRHRGDDDADVIWNRVDAHGHVFRCKGSKARLQ